MLFGVWRRAGTPLPPSLGQALSARFGSPGATRFDGASTSLAAWAPAVLHKDEDGGAAAATAYAAARGGHSPPGHPTVRVTADAMTIEAGPLPQYPIYYARGPADDYLVVCSQLEPVARLFPHAPLHLRRLLTLLSWGADLDSDGTVYTGIRRIRPCEKITASADGIQMARVFPRLSPTYRPGRADDFARELREQLDAAVARAVGGSDRVAVLVSGGLDSSGVLALAAARCRATARPAPEAISLQYASPGDDRPHLAELARFLALEPVRLSGSDAAPWFLRSLCADGQPIVLASTCLTMLLGATAVERKADVVLSGVSGDTICGGMLPFSELVRRGRVLAAVNEALRVRVPWGPMGAVRRLRQLVFSPLVPEPVRRIRRRLARRPPWMTARTREALAPPSRAGGGDGADQPPPGSPDAWFRRLCTRDEVADGATFAGQVAAVTGCYPVDVYLDEEFVRFMLEVDPILLSHNHEYRGLYKLAMKGVLPEGLRTRQDKAWLEPAIGAAALAAGAFEALEDLASLRALGSRGLVDPAPVRPTFDAVFRAMRRGERADKEPADEQMLEVWQLLSVEAFLRESGAGRALA